MKIVNRKTEGPKLLNVKAGQAFRIPGGIYSLPADVTFMRVVWSTNQRSEKPLYDRDSITLGRGLNQELILRRACVNLATGQVYMIGEQVGVEILLDAEVRT